MTSIRDDAQLVAALQRMDLADLAGLQQTLHQELRDHGSTNASLATALGAHSIEVAVWLRFQQYSDDSDKVVMLLGAVAVAIAWMTYRNSPASTSNLHQTMATIREGRVYMLPVPRTDPCICGSHSNFKSCHGMPPVAAPAM
jgi:hypothetical protein